MGSKEEIGKNIKKAREKIGFTQLEVATKAGINVNYYARIERGEARASTDALKEIVRVLKVKSSDIFPF